MIGLLEGCAAPETALHCGAMLREAIRHEPLARWLLEEGGLSDYQAGCLRTILSGAVYTEERAWRHFNRGDPICPFCNTREPETRFHLWWKCPRWHQQRKAVL